MFIIIRGVTSIIARGSIKRCLTTQPNPALPFSTSTQSNYVLKAFQDRKNIPYHAPSDTELCTRKLSSGNTAPAFPPVPTLVLGVGLAIPFLFPPLYMMNSGVFCSTLHFSHLAYGASIISFIGGVRWGLTLAPGSAEKPNWRNLTYSVAPSLLGWSGLLVGAPYGYISFTYGLLLSLTGYPMRFRPLDILFTLMESTAIILLILWYGITLVLLPYFILISCAKLRCEEEAHEEEYTQEE